MIQNYFKIAWRNLKRQPFFTFLNTFGLTIGMAGAILICLFIYDELNYDTNYADADRIYRINSDIKFGGETSRNAEVSALMAEAMENDFPQVALTTRFRNRGSMLIKKQGAPQSIKEEQVAYTDASMFKMFGFELLYGDAATALKEQHSIVLTRSAAEKHFKIENAVGETVMLDNTNPFIVTGVIEDFPENTFIRNHNVFISMTGYDEAENGSWGSNNFYTFVKLFPSSKIEELQVGLETIFRKYIVPYAQEFMPGITEEQFLASGNFFNFSTTNVSDIHLHSDRFPEMSANGSIQNVYILSFIALFLIVLASVNFMNLSTAHSLKRAKEVGIRKTLGSGKFDLIFQFLSESGLIALISMVFAIVMAVITMPVFNELSGKELSIPYTKPIFWILVVVSGITLGILSGVYPAFFMSKFIPVKVLKGNGDASSKGGGIRSALVVFQFSISVFLIVCTLVVFQQIHFIQNKELGYTKDRILIIEDVDAAGNQAQTFKQEVDQLTQVKNSTLSSFFPTPSNRNDTSFFSEESLEQGKAIQMQRWRIDFDYVSTFDLELIAGRDFNKNFGADSLSIIINEAAVTVMQLKPEEALGVRVTNDLGKENPKMYSIIGVVKDFHFESLRENISALSLKLGNNSNALAVKINAGDYSKTIKTIEEKWASIAPGQPFGYYFLDDAFNRTYEADQRLGRVFSVFTILSILIACLGLFGLAAFSAEKRRKEIGVRKVMGASIAQITYKLSIDFLKLVFIAVMIAIPLAWYAMNKWLEDFTYRIEIGIGIFILAIFLAILISVLTLGFQSVKAAIVNPIKSLRSE